MAYSDSITNESGVNNRRIRTIERLQNQLKTGQKNFKQDNQIIQLPLSEIDIKRINKEITTLQSRIR